MSGPRRKICGSDGSGGVRTVARIKKKECLILTNEAVMLLKTNDRENERSRTKPILVGGKTVGCSRGRRLPRRAGDRRIRFGRGALRAPDDAGAGTAPIPKHECRPRSAGSELHLSLFARRGGGTAQEQPGCHRDPVLESMASPTALSLAEGQTGL